MGDGVAVIESEGGQDLVVSGSTKVDFPAEIAEFLGEPIFDCGVAIFFFQRDLEFFVSEFVETLGEFLDFVGGEMVLFAEHLRVGDTRLNIVGDEALVEDVVLTDSEFEDLLVDGSAFIPKAG